MSDLQAAFFPDQDEYEQFELATKRRAERAIRLHPRNVKLSLPFETKPVPWFDRGRLLTNSELRPSQSLQFAVGEYYIQDAGSMLALELLNAQPGELICDLCAAPGAKASSILESLAGQGGLLANEVIRSRAEVLEWSLARVGQLNYGMASRDPDVLSRQFACVFDAVLVDAPCSGQTLVAKDKRDNNAFADEHIAHSAERQTRILNAAWRLLRPGGRLIYSTCTFSIEENESQIERLMNSMPGCWEPLHSDSLKEYQSPIHEGCYRLWPHRHSCAGAFAAGLRFLGVAPGSSKLNPWPSKSKRDLRSKSESRSKREPSKKIDAKDVVRRFGDLHHADLRVVGDDIQAVSEQIQTKRMDRSRLLKYPEIVKNVSSKTPMPLWPLAMLDKENFAPTISVELDSNQAISYMNGHALSIQNEKIGWKVATWQGRPLGWIKQIDGRANNSLPKHARINLDREQILG